MAKNKQMCNFSIKHSEGCRSTVMSGLLSKMMLRQLALYMDKINTLSSHQSQKSISDGLKI